MNCELCKELLHDRARGALSPQHEAEVGAHLRGCAACARAETALLQLHTLLDAEVTPSPDLRRRVLASLDAEAARQPAKALAFGALFARLWPSRPLGAFAYSLTLVLCGVYGGQLLPGTSADPAASNDGLYQLCPVPERPSPGIL